jgi:hypothetical protein
MWELVGRVVFATTKPPKRHIKHELDAHLSTPLLLTFLLWYLPNKGLA